MNCSEDHKNEKYSTTLLTTYKDLLQNFEPDILKKRNMLSRLGATGKCYKEDQ